MGARRAVRGSAALGGALSSASGFEVRGRGKQTLVNFLVPKSTFWGLPRLVWYGDAAQRAVFALFYSKRDKLQEMSCVGSKRVL